MPIVDIRQESDFRWAQKVVSRNNPGEVETDTKSLSYLRLLLKSRIKLEGVAP